MPSCPTCGRIEADLVSAVSEIEERTKHIKTPLNVSVMGCVVNGPGEASSADIGIAAGRGRGHLFIKGQVVRVVPEAEMVDALVDEARKLAAEGIEARLAAADVDAAAMAAETAIELRSVQGDANRSAQRRAAVAEVAAEGA